jgi:endonuclease-8
MPEGPQVHLVALRHTKAFAGRPLHADSPDGRSDDVAALVDGHTLVRVDAVGKHLFYVFDDDVQVHIHLGRFGWFEEGPMPLPEVKGMLRLRMWNDERYAELRGAIAIEHYDSDQRAAVEKRIGPDPLNHHDPDAAFAKIAKSKTPIGVQLMDQSVVAGVGNIFRAEVLFRQGVSPHRMGTSIDRPTFDRIWDDLIVLMERSVRDKGRIVTTEPRDRKSKKAVTPRPDRTYVYHREGMPCRHCGTTILRGPMGSRTVYWCPTCQPALAGAMGPVKIESPKPRHARGTLVHTEAMASTPAERAARTPGAKPATATKLNAAKRKSLAKKAASRRPAVAKMPNAENRPAKRTPERGTSG